MNKITVNFLMLSIVMPFTISCSSSPEKTAQQESALDMRIYSHKRDAQIYRDLGNDKMASHFEAQANESQDRQNDLNNGPIDFLLNLGVEAIIK